MQWKDTINIILIYAPIRGKVEENTKELQEVLDKIREQNGNIIIMRDWNAIKGNNQHWSNVKRRIKI